MNTTTNRTNKWLLALFLAALAALALPLPALADDELPPVPTEPAVTEESTDTSAQEASVPSATEVATDELIIAADTLLEETAVPAITETSATVEDTASMPQLPVNTELIVMDETGAALPLVSTEAAEALATGDPIWCPATVSMPVDGGSGCSPSFSSFSDLLTWLYANDPAAEGKIWVHRDYVSGLTVGDVGVPVFTVDGQTLTNMAQYPLMLLGGWNGLGTGTAVCDLSTFNSRLEIISWNADISLNNLQVTGSSGGNALTVTTTKDITGGCVSVFENDGGGALFDNTANGTGSGNIQTFGTYNNNGGTGLTVNSNGLINLYSVHVEGNAGAGAIINNSTGGKDVNVSGHFDENTGGTGISIVSKGAVTVTASAFGNGGDGAYINNAGATNPKSITLSELLTYGYNQNLGDGIDIQSVGTISLNHITASGNGGNGIYANNNLSSLAQNVSVSGGSWFQVGFPVPPHDELSENGLNGMFILSKGSITLTDIDAINNLGSGAILNNTLGNQSVTLQGTNLFSGNGQDGFVINTKGTIVAGNVSANGNAGFGAVLNNSGAGSDLPINFAGVNEFSFNGGGLLINSRGAVTLKNVYANYNSVNEGASIDNSSSTTGAGVTLTGTNQFNQNGSHGLEIISRGIITISKPSANGNGFAVGALTGFGAHLDNSTAFLPKLISLTTSTNFSDNFNYGLLVESKGAVSIALLSADRNGGNGAEINNLASGSATPQNVTLTGTSSFRENDGIGLTINTFGTVLLGGVTASDNNADGAVVNNSTGLGTLPKAVTLNGSNNFINNGGFGVQINSLGAITLNAVFADENFLFGAGLNNSTATTTAAVLVKGTSEFNDNGGYGLNIQSKGNITVYNFDSMRNGDYGTQLINNIGSSVGNVSIITTLTNWCNGLDENNGRGLLVTTFGAVNLSNICATSNLGEGIRIENQNAGSAKSVKISGPINYAEDNDETGIVVLSKGAITINSVYSSGNGWNDGTDLQDGLGMYLNNRFGGTGSLQNVTLTGDVSLYDNFYSGLEIYSYGSLSLANVTADNNGNGELDDLAKHGFGVLLNNQIWANTTVKKSITLTGTNIFSNNWSGGLKILGSGPINLSNIKANDNNGTGVYLNNDIGSGSGDFFAGNLTISGSNEFSGNNGNGIFALTHGSMSLSNLICLENFATGADLITEYYPGNVTITGTNNRFNWNGGDGLHLNIYAGNLTASNLYAYYNTGSGVYVLGSLTTTLSGSLFFVGNGVYGLRVSASDGYKSSSLYAAWNHGDGVFVRTQGPAILSGSNTFTGNWDNGLNIEWASVTLNNVTASNNGEVGVLVDNTDDTSSINRGFKLTGTNMFSDNGWDGLAVMVYGSITANNITANWNGGSGAYLDNLWDYDTHGGITLTGTNIFNNNLGPYSGLDMYSHGSITVNNVTANENSGGGATAWNWSYTGSPVKVTFTGTNTINSNLGGIDQGFGLYVKTEGVISLNNVTANGNEQGGVYLNNYDWSWTNPSITISGINEFSNNGLNGIYILSDGNVSLTRVTAELNTQTGVSIDTTGTVTLTCASLNFNEDRGWQIRGLNGITLIAVLTYGNMDGNYLWLGGSITIARTCTLP